MRFGGGRGTEPRELTIGGRATFSLGKKRIPAERIARKIHEHVGGLREVQVLLLSRIGTPINEPQTASAQVLPLRGRIRPSGVRKAEAIMSYELSMIRKLCNELSRGKYPVC